VLALEPVEDGQALFGGLEAKITLALLRWLVTVPDFAGGNVAGLARTTTAIAFGLLGAVMTLATIRYWLSGLSGGAGGAEAIEGLTRTVAAALVIVLWPWLFARATGLANAASGALLDSPGGDPVTAVTRLPPAPAGDDPEATVEQRPAV